MKPIRSTSLSNTSALSKYWDRRKGVTDVDVIERFKIFKFNLIEFGNWINQELRTSSCIDILKGCEDVLRPLLKSRNLGFDNSINIAIGSRGKKGSLAYFSPSTMFLSFKKYSDEKTLSLNGVSSFAHEYFHSLDYLIGRYIEPNKKVNYLSETWDNLEINTPIRRAISDLLMVYYEEQFKRNNNFLNGVQNKSYWQSPKECFARISEQCVSLFAESEGIKQNITRPLSYYKKITSVYMPKDVMYIVYPYWKEVVKIFSMVLRGKTVEVKKENTKSKQGALFAKGTPNSKKKTTKTKKK